MQDYKGFYKIKTSGGTFISEWFYNPTTNEFFVECTRDYEYQDSRKDIDELYYLPLCKEAKEAFLRHVGGFYVGDKVKIVKGRKMVGETKEVKAIYDYKPQAHDYGNRSGLTLSITYLYFTDGTKCQAVNCEHINPLPQPKEVSWEEVKARP